MEAKTVGGFVVGAVGVIVGLSALLGSFYSVDQTERGVILRNGALVGTAEPGLHWKVPFIDSVNYLSVKTDNIVWSGQSTLETYSKDLQLAHNQLSVTYHVPDNKVEELYMNYRTVHGMVETLVVPRVAEQFKNVFGQYDAGTAINNRAGLNAAVQDAIKKSVVGPVIIDSVQVTDVKFSSGFEASVEARMTAQIEVQKREQNLQMEKVQAQIVQTKADAEAYRVKATGNAEATAIKAKSDALAANPALVSLTAAEKWNGVLPSTMVPGGSVPFLNIPKQ